MKCIYCKNEITNPKNPPEHVFPQSFDCPDSFVLDCVCQLCNNEFGRTIDRVLASDSLEGLWRLQRIGSRSGKPVSQQRVALKIPEETHYEPFAGATVYADFGHKDTLYMPSQIFFEDEDRKKHFILIDDILKETINPDLMERIKTQKYWMFFQDSSEQEKTLTALEKTGLKFKAEKEGKFPLLAEDKEKGLKVLVESKIDESILRAISKIAFNYVAFYCGTPYVLRPEFDGIREYINSGTKGIAPIASIVHGQHLSESTGYSGPFEGHIFILETVGARLLARITLSNRYRYFYRVDVGETSIKIKSGDTYILDKRRMVKLFSPDVITLCKGRA